jgi:hypothetical protein
MTHFDNLELDPRTNEDVCPATTGFQFCSSRPGRVYGLTDTRLSKNGRQKNRRERRDEIRIRAAARFRA